MIHIPLILSWLAIGAALFAVAWGFWDVLIQHKEGDKHE